jgi:hypothetical protein
VEYSRFQGLRDARDPKQKLLKLYLGGEDLNGAPLPMSDRCILDVDGLTPGMMSEYPDVLQLLKERVRVDFLSRNEIEADAEEWWNFRRPADELRKLWVSSDQILCIARVSQSFAFTFIPAGTIANEKIVLFRLPGRRGFALLQSRTHEVWARFFSATMKDDLQYALTDCFETFPFPEPFETDLALEVAGQAYYDSRADLMIRNNEGLTKTYNRFHDPNESSPDILRLRELHAAMDRAVLDAYGWADIPTDCEFLLDYEEEDDEADGAASGRRRRKPWRYRWPDAVRDEVLARLLDLNAKRAVAEGLAGAGASGGKSPARPQKSRRMKSGAAEESLPGFQT